MEDMGIKLESSYFDGTLLQLIGWNLAGFFLTLFTAGICYPWAICMIKSWEAKHTVVSGYRLYFNGTATQLFGTWIKWWLLTFVTLGIYGLWLPIKSRQWVTKHTVLDEPVMKNVSDGESSGRQENDKTDDTRKPKKSAFAAGVLTLVLLLGLAGGVSAVRGGHGKEYLDEAEWALGKNYMFAVEVEGFDGDIFRAGTYDFFAEIIDEHEIPALFDVYVGYQEYSDVNDVIQNCEFIGTVGGRTEETATANLSAGSYVYVMYNDVATAEHGNVLNIKCTEPAYADEAPAEKTHAIRAILIVALFIFAVVSIIIAVVLASRRKISTENGEHEFERRKQEVYSSGAAYVEQTGTYSAAGVSRSVFIISLLAALTISFAGLFVLLKFSWWGLAIVGVGLVIFAILYNKA